MSEWRSPEEKATPTPKPSAFSARFRIIFVASGQIGTTEATGWNGGEVEKYLIAVGLKKGDPYCAAFVYWVGREPRERRTPSRRSGWSPDQVKGGSLVSKGTTAKPGNTFGIHFPSKGRVVHTGFVEVWGSGSVVTIEANTSPQAMTGKADRNGDGTLNIVRTVPTPTTY